MFMADISGGLSCTQAIAKHTDIGCILKCLDEGYIPDVYGVVTNDGGAKVCVQLKGVSIEPFDLSVSVSLTKTDSGGTAIRIPGSEWYLEASTQSGA